MPAIAQITISGNLPASSGGTYTLPITVSAHATGNVGGWQVYFGNTSYYSSSTGLGGYLDVNLNNVPTGTYQVTVTAYESGNGNVYASYVAQNVKVISNPLPTPPSGWTSPTYPNLQNPAHDPGHWDSYCPTGCSNGSSSLTQDVASPSLSGASMAEYAASNNYYYDILYYQYLGCPSGGCEAVGNMIDDFWFYTAPSPSNGFQQLEFDPDLYDSYGYEYQGSVACRMNGTDAGTWYVWDMNTNSWVSASRSCTITPQQWHHLSWNVAFNTSGSGCPNSVPCYTYKTLVFDGTTVFSNLGWSYNADKLSSYTTTVNVQQEIDNFDAANVANHVYYDNYNLWVW
jgi:hypothetical protein